MEINYEEYDIEKSAEHQEEYCKERQFPLFAPYQGRCFSCHNNIYKPIQKQRFYLGTQKQFYISGITTETASKTLITGCPHCGRSFCD